MDVAVPVSVSHCTAPHARPPACPQVTVCESHYLPGGAAHSFDVAGYTFDAGPSFHAGLSGPPSKRSANPLKQVLDAVGESVECATYDSWVVYTPEGVFPCVADGQKYKRQTLMKGGGEQVCEQDGRGGER